MAEIDTSIYKTAPPAPINLLQQFGQVVGIQNAQQQNRLLQQQQDLRAGMGAAIQGAVDPVTGQVDSNKLLATVGQDPRTSWNFGDVNQQTQGNIQATAAAQQEQLKNALAHTQAANGIIGGVLGNPNLGKTDMRQQIVDGVYDLVSHSDGKLTAKQAREAIIPTIPTDPQGQLQWVRDKANQNLSLQGRIQEVLGGVQGIGTGGNTTLIRAGAAGGVPQVVGQLPNTLSPGEKVQGQPTVVSPGKDAAGNDLPLQPGTVPVGTRFDPYGNPIGSPAPAQPNPLQPSQSNRLTTKTGAPPAPTAAPQSTLPAGFLPTAPAAGVSESQGADVARYKTDQAAIPTHATNVQSLQKAKVALEALSQEFGGSGKGTDTLNHVRSVITSLTGAADASTMNWDEAKKYLTDYARQQGAAAHSDLQLQAAQGSNASTDISNKAALDVVKTNIGRERQAIAQVMEHANPTGIGYGAHASTFATKTDPRAFAWDQYTPAERKTIMGNLSGDALKKFKDSIVIADRLGLIRAQ